MISLSISFLLQLDVFAVNNIVCVSTHFTEFARNAGGCKEVANNVII